MADRIEDFNLPHAVVRRLIKDALPANINVSKEAGAAIARAASIFAIYLTSASTNLAHKQNHKMLKANDILQTLPKLDFENFVEPIKQSLESYRKLMQERKESKSKKTKPSGNTLSDNADVNNEVAAGTGITDTEISDAYEDVNMDDEISDEDDEV